MVPKIRKLLGAIDEAYALVEAAAALGDGATFDEVAEVIRRVGDLVAAVAPSGRGFDAVLAVLEAAVAAINLAKDTANTSEAAALLDAVEAIRDAVKRK